MNAFITSIFVFLNSYYVNSDAPKASFISQLAQVKLVTKTNPCFSNIKSQLKTIDEIFALKVLREFDNNRHHVYTKLLNQALRTEFYPV